mgnify:CR=1 FL=1
MNTGYQAYPQPQAYPQQYSQLQPSGFLDYESNEMVVFGILAIIGYILYTSYLKSKKSPDADADADADAAAAAAAAAAADADADADADAAICKQHDDSIECSLDKDGKVYSFWGNMGLPNGEGGYGGCSSITCEWFTTDVEEGSSCEATCREFTENGFNYGGSYETELVDGTLVCGCVSNKYIDEHAEYIYWNRPNNPGDLQYVKNTFRGNFKLPSQT